MIIGVALDQNHHQLIIKKILEIDALQVTQIFIDALPEVMVIQKIVFVFIMKDFVVVHTSVNRLAAGGTEVGHPRVRGAWLLIRQANHRQKTYQIQSIGENLGLGTSNSLHLKDSKTGVAYLINFGAEVSVVPKPDSWEGQPFYAANLSPINVYGVTRRKLPFELNLTLDWQFYVANVPHSILGGDALVHFHLLPDLKTRTLVDPFGRICGRGSVALIEAFSQLSLVDVSHPYHNLLKQFLMVIGLADLEKVSGDNGVFHRIKTTDAPIALKTRRPSAEKLEAAELEYSKLCNLGLA